jgi:hypothetical protein
MPVMSNTTTTILIPAVEFENDIQPLFCRTAGCSTSDMRPIIDGPKEMWDVCDVRVFLQICLPLQIVNGRVKWAAACKRCGQTYEYFQEPNP